MEKFVEKFVLIYIVDFNGFWMFDKCYKFSLNLLYKHWNKTTREIANKFIKLIGKFGIGILFLRLCKKILFSKLLTLKYRIVIQIYKFILVHL